MPATFTSAVHAISERAKQHNASVQGAYEAFYGVGSRTGSVVSTSNARSARASVASAAPAEKKTSTWSKVKQAAKEHHRAANDAYLTFYGGAAMRNQS